MALRTINSFYSRIGGSFLMKVLLVSCSKINNRRLFQITTSSEPLNISEIFGPVTLPLGIMSIEAYLKKVCPQCVIEIISHDVQFKSRLKQSSDIRHEMKHIADNFAGFLMEEIKEAIKRDPPDIIGLSIMFDSQISVLSTVVTEINRLLPETLIVAGGNSASSMAAKLLEQNPRLDAVCIGEGEEPFAKLVNAPDKLEFLSQSTAFATRRKYSVGFVPEHHFMQNLDDIPSIYESSLFEKYSEHIFSLDGSTFDSEIAAIKQGALMTSRGCPYQCVFCAAYVIHGRKIRANSIDRVKSEIDLLYNKYDVQQIGILDDHFLFDVERAIEIIDYIGQKKLSIKFHNGFLIAAITPELVECLVRNNVKDVYLALESGSARVLKDIIRKPLTLDIAERVFNYFKGTDIFLRIFLVVGLPGETVDDIKDALVFLRTASFHWADVSSAIPISGSELYSILVSNGGKFDIEEANFYTDSFVPAELSERFGGDLRYTMHLDVNFVHNPYMRMGEYAKAAKLFESLIAVSPDHAFAHYYLEKCLEHLGKSKGAHFNRFRDIISQSVYWHDYAIYFNL